MIQLELGNPPNRVSILLTEEFVTDTCKHFTAERRRELAAARQARELAHQQLCQLPPGLRMPVLAVA